MFKIALAVFLLFHGVAMATPTEADVVEKWLSTISTNRDLVCPKAPMQKNCEREFNAAATLVATYIAKANDRHDRFMHRDTYDWELQNAEVKLRTFHESLLKKYKPTSSDARK